MFENMRLAFQGIWSHKMRSALTMLGIIIGIASIISIVSMMKGTNEQIKQNLIGNGNNIVEGLSVGAERRFYHFRAHTAKSDGHRPCGGRVAVYTAAVQQ